jgi:hypothetical protein
MVCGFARITQVAAIYGFGGGVYFLYIYFLIEIDFFIIYFLREKSCY